MVHLHYNLKDVWADCMTTSTWRAAALQYIHIIARASQVTRKRNIIIIAYIPLFLFGIRLTSEIKIIMIN